MPDVDIKRVQKRLLEMAVSISTILEQHNIPYMIAYGTLLGAIRHKGFIPWDDDFDFFLFDDTYDEAIDILRSELPQDMFVENNESEPLYFHAWAHVKDMFTVAFCEEFPQDSSYSHKGLAVDLYRTKCQPLSGLEKFLCDENEKYIKRRKEKGLMTEDEYVRRISALNEQKKLLRENSCSSDESVYNLVPYYKCHYIYQKDVFPLRKYDFEGYVFRGPKSGEKILTDIYGDYMKLPPVDKRRCHYSGVEFKI